MYNNQLIAGPYTQDEVHQEILLLDYIDRKEKLSEKNRNYFIRNKEQLTLNRKQKTKYGEFREYDRTRLAKIKLNPIKYARHILKQREWGKKTRQKLKALIISNYSNGENKCKCCGETISKFLTLDHILGKGNEHRLSIGMSARYGLVQAGR